MNFTSVLLNVVVPLQFSPPVVNMAKLMTFYTILDSASIIQDKTKALASFQAKGCIKVTGIYFTRIKLQFCYNLFHVQRSRQSSGN